jgi:hypothetical protein
MGYHIKKIKRGEVGEISKIKEELDEVYDASEQKSSLMILLELSDLIGAINEYLIKHHPSININDLIKMSEITKRAFLSGERN